MAHRPHPPLSQRPAPRLRLSGTSRVTALLAVLLSGAGQAHAEPSFGAPPPAGAAWLHVRTGLTFADSLSLDTTGLLLSSTGDPSTVLGIGAHWRTSRFDFGVLVESLSSWTFPGLERDNRVGGQFRAAACLRWRYIEDTWGSLFLNLSPGLTVLSHADPVRLQVANFNGSALASVSDHSLGFSFGFDFGALIYLDDELALSLDLDLISITSAFETGGGEVDLDMVRGVFGLGLEWRM